jgi:hypothetical protein
MSVEDQRHDDPAGWKAIDSLMGIGKAVAPDVSDKHDDHLYGDPRERRSPFRGRRPTRIRGSGTTSPCASGSNCSRGAWPESIARPKRRNTPPWPHSRKAVFW